MRLPAAATLLFRPPQPLPHGGLLPPRLSSVQHLPFARPRRHSSSTSTASSPPPTLPSSTGGGGGGKAVRRRARDSPEGLLRHQLDMCSRNADLPTALSLYDAALSPASPIRLSLHHYNCLLYLCSTAAASSPEAAQRGYEIFSRMEADHVEPNEATLTSVARLAAARRDPPMAFSLVRRMAAAGIAPRLRTYGPALFAYCDAGNADGAREVEAHMDASGVVPEEPELAALLRVNADKGRADEVYRVLHRTRVLVRQVCEATAQVVEAWFGSDAASEAGLDKWDADKVKEGVVKGGGGWHGQGWLGKGQWSVGRSEMDKNGTCQRCGEKLVCIDIDPSETENFAKSLTELACKREVKEDFVLFQDWLRRHGPFDAVIDAANVGLYDNKAFSFSQVNSVVNGIRRITKSKKLPLIILHRSRVNGGPAKVPYNQKLLQSWRSARALYATPPGSNDDWYWLYAAVSCRSLLVTNDEMRDHLFQLLGTSFFPRWKEKHQGSPLAAITADIVLRGYIGWNSRRALEVIDKVFPKDSPVQPCLIIVYFGGNDSIAAHSSGLGPHVPLEEYIDNMRKIAEHLKSLSEKTRVIFLSCPPLNEEMLQKSTSTVLSEIVRTNETCRLYSEACVSLCKEMDLKVVDLWNAMQKRDDWATTCFTDGLHLSEEGSKIVVEEILTILKEADWDPCLHWKALPTEFGEDSSYDLVSSSGQSTVNPSEWTFHRQIPWD